MSAAARLPNGVERRAAVELRAAGRRLEGYAAVWDTPTRISGAFLETVKRGAFRASLESRADILALVDHDAGRLLARTSSGTLRLAEDARGLHFSLDVPDTSLGRDVLALAERRDLGGMSLGFRATDEAWLARDRRELRAVQLVEVSVIHGWPAVASTSVEARVRDTLAAMARRRFLETL